MPPLSEQDRFAGTAFRLTAADVAEVAAELGLESAHIRAVLEVESLGDGFDPATKRPIILFEPHVFHRLTGGRFGALRPDLSYKRQGARAYPATQDARYRQLASAALLNEDAALDATSWGLFQILGLNHESAGFPTVQAFVAAMMRSERDQLDAFARFITNTGLIEALRQNRWAAFARGYNGPDYARHAYDRRLATAFRRERSRLSADQQPG